jgi:biopolymer transport protein ExbB/TolQ
VTESIKSVLFRTAELLEVPVLIGALVCLALVVIEAGAFTVEVLRRRRRGTVAIETAALNARRALRSSAVPNAIRQLAPVASSAAMRDALERLVNLAVLPLPEQRIAKLLADFDYSSLRRLERTRLLVRFGPALGLMGTLIPLSPALSALASGDVKQLSNNLRVAFSVTVLGLLIGAVAFAISLVRDRLYGQDLSDLQYVAAILTSDADLE